MMAINVPVAGTEINASTFGIPVTNEVNRIGPLVDSTILNYAKKATMGNAMAGVVTAGFPILIMAETFTVTTTGFGDFVKSFPTPFPHAIYGIWATLVSTTMFGSFSLSGAGVSQFQGFFFGPQQSGFTGHPPGEGSVWTPASKAITVSYVAIGT
jgi:hypothetical protein